MACSSSWRCAHTYIVQTRRNCDLFIGQLWACILQAFPAFFNNFPLIQHSSTSTWLIWPTNLSHVSRCFDTVRATGGARGESADVLLGASRALTESECLPESSESFRKALIECKSFQATPTGASTTLRWWLQMTYYINSCWRLLVELKLGAAPDARRKAVLKYRYVWSLFARACQNNVLHSYLHP